MYEAGRRQNIKPKLSSLNQISALILLNPRAPSPTLLRRRRNPRIYGNRTRMIHQKSINGGMQSHEHWTIEVEEKKTLVDFFSSS
uniref:Uncharacterized protein n=1 Tax=Solanum tuberosum TaxID=4113 RepID=M0ZW23_SOLTU